MGTKLFCILLLLSVVNRLLAQSLEMQVIGTAGNFQTAGWGSLSNTVGESVTQTFTTTSIMLTQGFQQPLLDKTSIHQIGDDQFSITVFPNPAADEIHLAIKTDKPGEQYTVAVLDQLGQRLTLPDKYTSSGTETNVQYDLRSLANGNYMMVVSDEHHLRIRSVKFTKIN